MSEEKRIYSLNLASYLRCKGHREEKMIKDDEGKVYFVFDEVGKDIVRYRQNEELQEFLREYKKVREDISKL